MCVCVHARVPDFTLISTIYRNINQVGVRCINANVHIAASVKYQPTRTLGHIFPDTESLRNLVNSSAKSMKWHKLFRG